MWTVEHFLHGKTESVTDYKPIETIWCSKTNCARIEQWVLRLQSFKFKIVDSSGRYNVPDLISRLCPRLQSALPFDEQSVNQMVKKYSEKDSLKVKEN